MQVLNRINAKLDLGWKMTNASCPTCNGTSLAEPSQALRELYCPKCDKTFDISEISPPQNEE